MGREIQTAAEEKLRTIKVLQEVASAVASMDETDFMRIPELRGTLSTTLSSLLTKTYEACQAAKKDAVLSEAPDHERLLIEKWKSDIQKFIAGIPHDYYGPDKYPIVMIVSLVEKYLKQNPNVVFEVLLGEIALEINKRRDDYLRTISLDKRADFAKYLDVGIQYLSILVQTALDSMPRSRKHYIDLHPLAQPQTRNA